MCSANARPKGPQLNWTELNLMARQRCIIPNEKLLFARVSSSSDRSPLYFFLGIMSLSLSTDPFSVTVPTIDPSATLLAIPHRCLTLFSLVTPWKAFLLDSVSFITVESKVNTFPLSALMSLTFGPRLHWFMQKLSSSSMVVVVVDAAVERSPSNSTSPLLA